MSNQEIPEGILQLSDMVKTPGFSIERFKKAVKELKNIPAHEWFYSLEEKEKPHKNIYNDLMIATFKVFAQEKNVGTELVHYLLQNNLSEKNVFFRHFDVLYANPERRDTYAHVAVTQGMIEEQLTLLNLLEEYDIPLNTINSEGKTPHQYYNFLKKSLEAPVYQRMALSGLWDGMTGYLLSKDQYQTEVDLKLEMYHLLKDLKRIDQDKPQETPRKVSSWIKRPFSTFMRFQKERHRN